MLRKLKPYIYCLIIGVSATMGTLSCTDDSIDMPDYTRTGDKVTLRVPFTLPEMPKQTRGELSMNQLNQVQSLWVRTYSARTGKATSKWVKLTPGTTDTEIGRTVEIETLSGSSFIVGVANVYTNNGVRNNDITTLQPLSELLDAADTWNDFLNIAVVSPSSSTSVYAPSAPLPMSGCYSDVIIGGTHPEPTGISEWQNKNFQPYFIPSQSKTVDFTGTGGIHLRRLVSHINFNFIPGDNIDVTVNSYQVMNAPRFSWLYERASEGGMDPNFGDQANDAEDAVYYYADVTAYNSQYVNKGDTGISTFDFWQGENKHTGTCSLFTDRDKKAEGDPVLFTSLTGNTWTPNNEASYVLVTCTVDYTESINVNQDGEITPGGEPVHRTGEVVYIIHLGYIGNGPESDKAKDFNCFRNVDYTYNVTVNGVNDIRLDAFATDETYHGEEGVVVDLTNATIDIDAHYAAFNVEITEDELKAKDFGFLIATYDNGRQITISDANPQGNLNGTTVIYTDNSRTSIIDPKYYNWIEIRPTTSENVLADYKPRYGGNSDGKTFLLTDLISGEKSTVWDNMAAGWKSTAGYYTVFVNEYTYEPIYTGTDGYADEQWNGTGRPGWMNYVNQNPRRFYIRVTQKTSPDNNSVYSRSKYGISQQSLMTYYSTEDFAPAEGDIPAGTAIAVERLNETNGLNFRIGSFQGGSSMGNGRWNIGQYLNGSSTDNNLSINGAVNSRPLWANYIETSRSLYIPEVASERLQGGPPIPGGTFCIPALVTFTEGTAPNFTDPQPSADYTIEPFNACMSRNRDNNGNGRIDPDELRWYVPSINKYIGLSLGTGALPDPLMDYRRITRIPYVNGGSYSTTAGSIINEFYSRYMYVGSNSETNVLWAIEGTSLSNYGVISSWAGTDINPWQVRCIRNLGSDMTTVTSDDKVSIPYVHNAGARTIRMSYLNLAAKRTAQYNGNGTGAGMMPVHTLNSSYNDVSFGFEYADSDITVPVASRPSTAAADFSTTYNRLTEYINSNPCGDMGTGWRLPNQLELTMMLNVGGVLNNASINSLWLSCTVNYISYLTGAGSNATDNKLFLVSTPGTTTQLTLRNLSNAGNNLFVRCVRDINE